MFEGRAMHRYQERTQQTWLFGFSRRYQTGDFNFRRDASENRDESNHATTDPIRLRFRGPVVANGVPP
mgnify:CR=1 FL=1